jgi:hypothetical protein
MICSKGIIIGLPPDIGPEQLATTIQEGKLPQGEALEKS